MELWLDFVAYRCFCVCFFFYYSRLLFQALFIISDHLRSNSAHSLQCLRHEQLKTRLRLTIVDWRLKFWLNRKKGVRMYVFVVHSHCIPSRWENIWGAFLWHHPTIELLSSSVSLPVHELHFRALITQNYRFGAEEKTVRFRVHLAIIITNK